MQERHFILLEGACGKGITKGNIVPLSSLGGLEPIRNGSMAACRLGAQRPFVFCNFFKKKLGKGLFFAEKHLGVGEYLYSLTDVFAEWRKFVS